MSGGGCRAREDEPGVGVWDGYLSMERRKTIAHQARECGI